MHGVAVACVVLATLVLAADQPEDDAQLKQLQPDTQLQGWHTLEESHTGDLTNTRHFVEEDLAFSDDIPPQRTRPHSGKRRRRKRPRPSPPPEPDYDDSFATVHSVSRNRPYRNRVRIEKPDEIQSRPRISGRRRKPYRFRSGNDEESISIQRRKPIRFAADGDIVRPRYHSRYRSESPQEEVEDFPVQVSRKNRVNVLNLQPNYSESEGQRLSGIENEKYEQGKLPHVVSSTEGTEVINLQEISRTEVYYQSKKYSTEKYTMHETDISPSKPYNENIQNPVDSTVGDQETHKIKYQRMKVELNGEVISVPNIKILSGNSNNGLISNPDEIKKNMTDGGLNTTSDIFRKNKTDQNNLHISEFPMSTDHYVNSDKLLSTLLKPDNLGNFTNENHTFREVNDNQTISISSKSKEQYLNSTQSNLSNFTYSDNFQESTTMKYSTDVLTITLHELLEMKNMTLQDVIKQNEAANPNGEENNEHRETYKFKLRARPYARRLPTPSELFSRKKLNAFANTMQTNTNKTAIINDYIKTTPPRIEYNDLLNKNLTLIEMSNSNTSKVTQNVVNESQMPLLMQEIDAINPIKEEENKMGDDEKDKFMSTTRNRGKQLNNIFSENSFINETNSTHSLQRTKPLNSTDSTYNLETIFDPNFQDADDIIDLLKSQGGSIHLARILMSRNMTLKELIEHRERGSSHQHLSDIFENTKVSHQEENHTENKTKHVSQISENGFKAEDSPLHISIMNDQQQLQLKTKSTTTDLLKQKIINSPKGKNSYSTSNEQHTDFPFQNMNDNNQENFEDIKNLLQSITSRKNNYDDNFQPPRNNFESYNAEIYSHSGVATDITNDEEGLLLYRDNQGMNDVSTAYDIVTAGVTEEDNKNLHHHRGEMSKVESIFPPSTKSAIVASSIVLGVGISVFLAVFIGCKLRQRALIQHGRRTGKMAAKSPILEGQVRPRNGTVMLVSNNEHNFRDESFIMNNQLSDFYVEPRRYYLWRTIRKTLKYK